MNKFLSVGITGTGSCLPERELTNFDLEKMVDTTDEWIKPEPEYAKEELLMIKSQRQIWLQRPLK